MSEEESKVETVDFKVYDMPVELKNKYISMAKLDYDNEMWKVLEAGMDALQEERERKIPELEQKVDNLQKQIVYLKTKIENLEGSQESKDESGPPKTFGDQKDVKGESGDDELLNRFSSK